MKQNDKILMPDNNLQLLLPNCWWDNHQGLVKLDHIDSRREVAFSDDYWYIYQHSVHCSKEW